MENWRHPDNGKSFFYEGGDLIINLGGGGAVRYNGASLYPYDFIPLYASPDVDTTTQVASAAGGYGHWGVIATKIGAKRQRTGGTGSTSDADTAKLIDVGTTTDGGTSYTDWSATVTDGNPATVMTLVTGGTAGDWIVVGHPLPFSGVYFDIATAHSAGLTGKHFVDIWNGTAWVDAGWDDLTGIFAGTFGAAFTRDGWMIADTSADPVALGWTPHELTVGSAKTRYWARIRTASSAATTATASGIELLPWRPNISTALFSAGEDGADRAGCFPHVLLSRTDEDGQHTTHDMWTLPQPDEIGGVLYGPVGGASRNDDRALILAGKNAIYIVQTGADERMGQSAWPILGTKGLVELPTRDLSGEPVTLQDIRISGLEWRGTGYLFARTEDGTPWATIAEWESLPATIPNVDLAGREWRFAIGWELTAAQARGAGRPRITAISAQPVPAAEQGALAVQVVPLV
jgi:hypothetical protein